MTDERYQQARPVETRGDRPAFQPSPPRWEILPACSDWSRHRHETGYVSVILSGGFEEAGDHGRRILRPGDVLLHAPYSGHAQRTFRDTRMLNFALAEGSIPPFEHGVVDDPDEILRVNEKDSVASFELLFQRMRPVDPPPQDWPDVLAQRIRAGLASSLAEWAASQGIHPAGLARGFRQLYRVSPSRYRFEHRARRAWQQLIAAQEPLSGIAHDLGFSDQAHMSRAVKALTGRTPGQWRRLKKFKN